MIIYCFFTVGGVEFCNNLFCDLCWGDNDSVWVCKGRMWKKLWEPL